MSKQTQGTPAYNVLSENGHTSYTFTGMQALPSARGTFERIKATKKAVTLTRGYIDSITKEYTATHTLEDYLSETAPYTCANCGKTLSFPETFFYGGMKYCNEHIPKYDKHQQW